MVMDSSGGETMAVVRYILNNDKNIMKNTFLKHVII